MFNLPRVAEIYRNLEKDPNSRAIAVAAGATYLTMYSAKNQAFFSIDLTQYPEYAYAKVTISGSAYVRYRTTFLIERLLKDETRSSIANYYRFVASAFSSERDLASKVFEQYMAILQEFPSLDMRMHDYLHTMYQAYVISRIIDKSPQMIVLKSLRHAMRSILYPQV